MSDQEILTPQEGGEAAIQPLSISDKFIGIITEPENTYENVRRVGPVKTDWVVPLLVLTLVIAIATFVRMSNPALREKIRQQQQEVFDKQVAQGKMTQQDADRASEMVEKMGPLQAVFSVVGVLIFVPLVFLIVAVFYWLILKFGMKGAFTYGAFLGVYGLTAYFGAIDQLLALILSLVTGNLAASVSPALLMKADITSPAFKLANALNPITIWSMWVLGIGVAKVGGIAKAKAYGVVFGLWLVWTLLSAFIRLPIPGM